MSDESVWKAGIRARLENGYMGEWGDCASDVGSLLFEVDRLEAENARLRQQATASKALAQVADTTFAVFLDSIKNPDDREAFLRLNNSLWSLKKAADAYEAAVADAGG